MVVLDLFSGAGGLSEGFWRVGAEFVAHVEADAYACDTLRTRAAYWNLKNSGKIKTYYKYLLNEITREQLWAKAGLDQKNEVINTKIASDTYQEIVEQVYRNMESKQLGGIDILIGGPPCQAYSNIGRSFMTKQGKVMEKDPRNYLFQYYVQFLHEFKPKYFVFENVPGLKTAGEGRYYRQLMEALRQEYHVPEPEIHNAYDYGVLQSRKRFIIVGKRKEKDSTFEEAIKIEPIKYDAIVNDLLTDLPALEPGDEVNGKGAYISKPSSYLKTTQLRPKGFNILTQHLARPHNENDRQIYNIAVDLWKKEKKILHYSELPKTLATHKNTKSFLDRFKVVKPDAPCSHTMIAHIAKDGHYYIHPDETQRRSLSVREAARIQSFPDDFFFEGPRTAVFTQIGNAVPPLMAERIAEKMKELLNNYL